VVDQNDQSIAPDGPSMPPPKKETCAAGKKEGMVVSIVLTIQK
jgi:hypothetical protein